MYGCVVHVRGEGVVGCMVVLCILVWKGVWVVWWGCYLSVERGVGCMDVLFFLL